MKRLRWRQWRWEKFAFGSDGSVVVGVFLCVGDEGGAMCLRWCW